MTAQVFTGSQARATHDACAEFHADPARIARARDALIDAPTASSLAETFRLLGDPTRVRMLDALSSGELCVCDLASLLGHTVSAVSHQLRLLRGVRLVRARRDGRMVFYSLDDHHIIGLLSQARRHVEEDAEPPPATTRGRRPRARS
jgi:ArsR family transcriptional regulator